MRENRKDPGRNFSFKAKVDKKRIVLRKASDLVPEDSIPHAEMYQRDTGSLTRSETAKNFGT